MSETFDVVIAGGAVIGSSIAYHLALKDPSLRVLVVEPDPTYQKSASALSAGSIRQQFSSAVNIDISLHGIRFLRQVEEHLGVDGDPVDIGLKEIGYLYVATEPGAPLLAELNALQNARGADIALYDAAGLRAQFPWLAVDDLAAGSWGRTGEGCFDGYGLTQAFRRKARSLGATYRQTRVVEPLSANGRVTGAVLEDGSRIACGHLVNAAGASGARRLAGRMGFAAPIFAKKRCVFTFRCPDALTGFPLLIDTSGAWVRPEGDGYITGYSPDDLDESDHAEDFEVDWSIFEETIWPALAARVPVFERLRPGSAWAGHYDMCLTDHNAMVGPLPGLAGGYLVAGFSGHGLQQSPAVGRGIAEHIVTGSYETIDLSPLAPARTEPLLERNII